MQINRLNLKPLESLPAGTEGDIAVCDGQLFLYTSNWNPISNSYTPWCFNSGTVDQFGFATCFEIEQNSILFSPLLKQSSVVIIYFSWPSIVACFTRVICGLSSIEITFIKSSPPR